MKFRVYAMGDDTEYFPEKTKAPNGALDWSQRLARLLAAGRTLFRD
jgi:hypothetical protein